MGAVVGLLHFDDSPVDRAVPEAMLESMSHRGSDNIGIWGDGAVGLGQRMFWTTPESLHERLPLPNAGNSIALTADARIDNRDELLSTLGISNPPAEVADSELILAAYERWREDCPDKLLGDFAFAIWDGDARRLFCARDHMGVKPFYYFLSGQVFAFATEIKGLWTLPYAPREINELQLARFLSGDDNDKQATFYHGILRLPPAHALTVSANGESHLRQYWELDRNLEIHLGSNEEYAERFREIFVEAVRCRTRSAYPVGSALSGGLDSSSIACAARNCLVETERSPLHVFSALFPTVPISDERPYIEAVVAQGGIEPHFFNADDVRPLYDSERLLQYLDDFYTGGNLHISWISCELAQKAGVRVFLHGFDGDTTVSHGFYRMKEMALAGDWREFVDTVTRISSEFKAYPSYSTANVLRLFGYPALQKMAQERKWLQILRSIEPLHQGFGIPRRRLLKDHILVPLIPDAILRKWRERRGGAAKPEADGGGKIAPVFAMLLNSGFARRVDLYKYRLNSDRDSSFNSDKEEHYHRLTGGTMSRVLELIDLTGAVFGMESRYPFNDKRLIEFCYAIPSSQKLQQGWSRYVLRRAMEGILPPEIQWRAAKSNIGPGLTASFRKFESDLLREVVLEHLEVTAPYVNSDRLKEAYQRYVVDMQDQDIDVIHLWLALKLYLWLSRGNMK